MISSRLGTSPPPCVGWAGSPMASPPSGRCCSAQWPLPESQPTAARGSSAFLGRCRWTAWSAEAKKKGLRITDYPSCSSFIPAFHRPLCSQTPPHSFTHLFVGHELNGRFRCNLQHVDAIPPPQWPWSTLSDHLGKTANNAHVVAAGGMNLVETELGLAPGLITTALRSSIIQGQKGTFFIYPEICQGFNPFQITSTIEKQASLPFWKVQC